MIVRRYEAGDEHAAIGVFVQSVRVIGPSKYSTAQVDAWLSAHRDPQAWAMRMLGRETFVALDGGRVVGWIEMENDGHVDFLYCSPEAAGQGVAGALYDELLARVREMRLPRLFSEASRFAEPFFLKRGWKVDAHEVVVRQGIEIQRARMSLELQANDEV